MSEAVSMMESLIVFCMLGNMDSLYSLCLPSNSSFLTCRLLTFFKINFFKNFFQEHNQSRVSNGLEPNQDRHSVSPDLGLNCLHRLSADDRSRC